MKKIVGKLLAVIMVAAMLLSLSGCVNIMDILGSSEEKKLMGKWEATVEMKDAINEELASDGEGLEYLLVDSFKLKLVMHLNEDNTYSVYADESSAKEAFEGLRSEWIQGLKKYLEDEIKKQGLDMTVEEVLNLSGTTIEAMLDEAITDEVLEEMLEDINLEGNFEAKDGKLYMSAGYDYDVDEKSYESYELKGDTLTLLDYTSDDDDDDGWGVYPIEFTKAD